MRYFFILLACLLTGCFKTTSELISETSASWAGQNADIFFDRFGQPKGVEKQEPNLVTYNWVGTGDSTKSMVTATAMGLAFTASSRLTSPMDLSSQYAWPGPRASGTGLAATRYSTADFSTTISKLVSEHSAAW